jgi:hypothetical protein
MRIPFWLRASVAGLAGGAAWFLGLLLLFGPAQGILTDPAHQSAKMLRAFAPGPDAPKIYEAPQIVIVGVLCIGLVWGWVYASIAAGWGGPWWKRGLRFGVVAWAMMALWFEFYLPWNVMHEPAPLVALELALWAGVMLLVGLAIAGVELVFRR